MDITTFTSKRFLISGIVSLVILIALATLPLYLPGYPVVLLTSILMYVIITVSWVIFSGPTHYISLASAAFFGVGIYTAAILGFDLPLPVVIIIAGLVSFIVALGVGMITLRLRGVYFCIFTFGLAELIRHSVVWWEVNRTGTVGRWVVGVDNDVIFYVMLAIFVVLILTAYFIRRSKFGLALQSIGANEEAAAHRGINVTMVKVITFAVSAFFMGAVGAIIATRWTYIDPLTAFNPLHSFMPVLMAIFGGMGQIYGPVIGAAIFAYLQEILTTRFPYYYMLIFGIILVIAILYLPDGLVGIVQRLWRRRLGEQHANT